MTQQKWDIAVIGGGIVGTATAMALARSMKGRIIVLEKEDKLAAHQTGNNSGVIHSGLYYKPGSLKAENCVSGRRALYTFMQERDIPHDQCGKLVVATREDELPRLKKLEERGLANGLEGLRCLSGEELKEYEPHARGLGGLWVPETGICDYQKVTEAFGEEVVARDGCILTGAKVLQWTRDNEGMVLDTTRGSIHCRFLVNCAGLQSDRVARMCGVEPGLKIIPFRGEYFKLKEEKEFLVKNLIYPVPDPQFPFLGVHFTRMIGGGVEAGPNAVPAFRREGYRKSQISLPDMVDTFLYRGFIRMGLKHWKMGFGEMYRSYVKSAFVRALQKMMPEISKQDVYAAGAGVRAQALEPDGFLVDDFRIVEGKNMVHVLNAPSPAATASISIGGIIAKKAEKNFNL